MRGNPDFGEKMAQARREGAAPPSGRPPMRSKYRRQIEAAEKTFAGALPTVAREYVDELRTKEPERCPDHHKQLKCPDCDYRSQRTAFDHRAASYVFDRLAGRPTSRSENSLTVNFIQTITEVLIGAFVEANELEDAHERQALFAERLTRLGAEYGGPAS